MKDDTKLPQQVEELPEEKEKKEKERKILIFLQQAEELLGAIEYTCAKNGVATDMLRATVECFLRLPFTTPQTTLKLLESIREMAERKIDFSLLLKAGIMMGMSYDYSRFKKTKRLLTARNKQNKNNIKILNTMADTLKEKGYEAEILDTAPLLWCKISLEAILKYKRRASFSRNCGEWVPDAYFFWPKTHEQFRKIAEKIAPGSKLLFEKKIDFEAVFFAFIDKYLNWHIDRITEILSLDTTLWQINSSPIINDSFEITIEPVRTTPQFILVQEDPFLRKSVFGQNLAIGVDETMLTDHEQNSFIAIYQRCVLNHSLYHVKTELEHLFAVKNGRFPNANEASNLRNRYYQFIQHAYPTEMAQLSEHSEESPFPRFLAGPVMRVRDEPNVFFLQSRPYRKRNQPSNDINPYVVGKMCYDAERKCYWLLPGTRLNSVDKKKLEIYPEMAALYKKARQERSIIIHRVANPKNNNDDATPKEAEKTTFTRIEVVFVHRRILVPSASFAAHMVLGYKRNGLDCWKNTYGQTLREYLKSLEQTPEKEISSESV